MRRSRLKRSLTEAGETIYAIATIVRYADHHPGEQEDQEGAGEIRFGAPIKACKEVSFDEAILTLLREKRRSVLARRELRSFEESSQEVTQSEESVEELREEKERRLGTLRTAGWVSIDSSALLTYLTETPETLRPCIFCAMTITLNL